ncbi:LamG-like jellyroll fold domain-containing protein [Sphingobacterium pedocola]|uniref:DUF4983 domain-containing protein n=1 Tax=Sphingobacterium pedocola TaxID=2082722 RepID=A0ABR9TD27_9SPHI|nr:LamG-like jellyroll fold domain-containing protein [Sphingobacterium pedocola]MBE8722952.1 hypothetical protein [Sphingobacterium pedocola]
MKYMIKLNRTFFLLTVTGLALASSCTKFANPEPQFEEYTAEVDTAMKRKVLVIAVDGLVGSQIKEYKPTTIGKLMEHSKYSYEAKADQNTDSPASWASLLTGYPSSQHKIIQESYMPSIDLEDDHAPLEFTPSLINRIEGTNKRLKTATVVQNLTMSNMLLADADFNNVESSDKGVEQKAIALLTDQKPDLSIVQFNGLLDAGKDGGFVVQNVKYKAALDQIDAYIGSIVAAIEAGDNFEKESWLIVITSPHGGSTEGSIGGVSDNEINTFSLYYNKGFKPLELKAESMTYFHANGYLPGTYNYYSSTDRPRRIEKMGVRAQSPAGTGSDVFNASTLSSKSITYDYKIKLEPEGFWNMQYNFTYNMILGKDADERSSTKGWNLYSGGYGTDFMYNFSNGATSISVPFPRGTDGEWHHYALSYKELSNSSTMVDVYVDGVKAASQTIAMGLVAFENQEPLTIGFTNISNFFAIPNYLISDLRVWNKSLTESEVRQIACLSRVGEENELYSNLLAHYSNFGGNNWINEVDNSSYPNLALSGNPSIIFIKNYSICTASDDAVYLQNIDLFTEIFYWLQLEINDDWKMPGTEFLNNFLGEFFEQ